MYTVGIANFFAKVLDNPFRFCYNSSEAISLVLTYAVLGLILIFLGVILSEFLLEWLEVKKWYREYKKHHREWKKQNRKGDKQ